MTTIPEKQIALQRIEPIEILEQSGILPLNEDDYQEYKGKSGVYYLLEDNKVAYIGRALCLASRLRTHSAEFNEHTNGARRVDSFKVDVTHKTDRKAHEDNRILDLNPKYNCIVCNFGIYKTKQKIEQLLKKHYKPKYKIVYNLSGLDDTSRVKQTTYYNSFSKTEKTMYHFNDVLDMLQSDPNSFVRDWHDYMYPRSSIASRILTTKKSIVFSDKDIAYLQTIGGVTAGVRWLIDKQMLQDGFEYEEAT